MDKYVSDQADAIKQAPVRIRSVKDEVREMRQYVNSIKTVWGHLHKIKVTIVNTRRISKAIFGLREDVQNLQHQYALVQSSRYHLNRLIEANKVALNKRK